MTHKTIWLTILVVFLLTLPFAWVMSGPVWFNILHSALAWSAWGGLFSAAMAVYEWAWWEHWKSRRL